MSEDQKTVLVTGSSRGIGKAIALRLARAGYDLAVHCRSRVEEAAAVQAQITALGRKARVLSFDLTDREGVRQVIGQDIERDGAYYGVVCNAGITRDAAFPMLADADWDQVIGTNLDGLFNVLSAVVTPMIRRKKAGRIVTMSSVSGLIGNRGQVNYSAAKAGIAGASKALAVELAKRKITVNCVAPGFIDTDMTSELVREEALKMVPARRAGTADEVAALVEFLMSGDAAYITRQVIAVNGGLC
jgi:3-oxoacyl-[acyl-carrier protein] reductase